MATNQNFINTEWVDWLAKRQARLNIVKTTTTKHGRVIDWIPIESQTPSGKIASPPPDELLPVREHDEQKPIEPARFEFEDDALERGQHGTVPVLRPDISKLTDGVSLKNYLRKQGGRGVHKQRRIQQPADPDPVGYFHNAAWQNGAFFGWDAFLNVWGPEIDRAPNAQTNHSILQAWLLNDSGVRQSIEGGWTVDQSLNGDRQPHIFTFFTTNNYANEGDFVGGYNSVFKGWVQYSAPWTTGLVVFPGIRIVNPSTSGGTQTDVSMKFQLYREPATGEVNWWVSVQGVWMGYYPATLFNANGLGTSADSVGCGGEVFMEVQSQVLTDDYMGSGMHADEGWTKAAYLRNIRLQTDMNGGMANFDGIAENDVAWPGAADPYTINTSFNSAMTWQSYFYVGGPIW
jgi:Neprosin